MNKVKIIAEIGNTHEGSLGLAKQLIKSASDSGADVVKFQTHIFEAESLHNAKNPPYFKQESRAEYFKRTSFTKEQYKELIRYAKEECGVEFISSPFSQEAVDFLLDLGINTLKIPSGEVNNTPLLNYIASNKNISVLLSSGMSNWEELDQAVEILKSNSLTILQCTSKYPCPPEEAGLNLISQMQERYKCDIGFSDHTLGVAVPIAAVVLGATVVEKHFTLSKLMYGSDAKNSVEPDEFKFLVNQIREVERSINSQRHKDVLEDYIIEMKSIFEKSIVINKNLKKGHILQESDLSFKKPGDGVKANKYKDFVGKVLAVDVNENSQINFGMIE